MLLACAGRRFHHLGYHRVSLADVAAEAGVTAPAVYRHFASKEGLLAGSITSGLDLVEDVMAAQAGLPLADLIGGIAEVGLDRPDLWVLLQREARFLGPDHRRAVQSQLDRIVVPLARRLCEERPGMREKDASLLVAGALAVLSTPSVFPTAAPRGVQHEVLVLGAVAVLGVELPRRSPRRHSAPRIDATPDADRRSQLLQHATVLFFERGYVAVTLDDIGASVGISGPSIYHHFATKVEILVAAFDSAVGLLAEQHRHAEAADLDGMVTAYIDFCLRNRALVGVYVSEAVNLPSDVRRSIAGLLRQQVARWSSAVHLIDGTVEPVAAEVRVAAALTLIADTVRLGHFYARDTIAHDIEAMAMAVLTQGANVH